MTQLHCVKPGCRSRGYHWPDCDYHVENCPGHRCQGCCLGCRPRLAADGLRLCFVDTRRLAEDAFAAAGLYDELSLVLPGSGRGEERTSGTRDRGAVINERAMECRTLIRHTLVSWCQLISEERGIGLPADDAISGISKYVAGHAEWLSAHPAAAEVADELHELAHGKPRRVAYPSGARVFVVGACPGRSEDSCEGQVRAVMRRVDALLPSELVCDLNDEHRWTADQWRALARELRSTTRRTYTPAEISDEWHIPLGSVYRLASEHNWGRADDSRRPVLYFAADVEFSMSQRPERIAS